MKFSDTSAVYDVDIWAPCYYAGLGIDYIFRDTGLNFNISEVDVISASAFSVSKQSTKIVVFLYGSLSIVMSGIKKLAFLLNSTVSKNWFPDILIIGDVPLQWLYETLCNLVPKNALRFLRFANSKSFFYEFKKNRYHFKMMEFPLLMVSTSFDKTCQGLTSKEFDILHGSCNGFSVNVMTELYAVSKKTIYTHRRSALNKMKNVRIQMEKQRRFAFSVYKHKKYF